MGDYDIVIDGISIKAKVVDSGKVLEELIPGYFRGEDILGIDLKSITTTNEITNNYGSKDSNICFVRVRPTTTKLYLIYGVNGVACSELASRVLKKQGLMQSSLGDLAREVGIPYQDVYASSTRIDCQVKIPSRYVYYCNISKRSTIVVDSKYDSILTQQQVKMAIYDAYRIASKLLSSLN
uniref:Uncharacterized protein n=1 Tax=Chenopodium quinoa TaxID=63459 RepID=A0A803L4E3_CHEQI